MPKVILSLLPGQGRRWVAIDQPKFSKVAGALPHDGGKPEMCRIENRERQQNRERLTV